MAVRSGIRSPAGSIFFWRLFCGAAGQREGQGLRQRLEDCDGLAVRVPPP